MENKTSVEHLQKCEKCDSVIGTNEIKKEGWKYLLQNISRSYVVKIKSNSSGVD